MRETDMPAYKLTLQQGSTYSYKNKMFTFGVEETVTKDFYDYLINTGRFSGTIDGDVILSINAEECINETPISFEDLKPKKRIKRTK